MKFLGIDTEGISLVGKFTFTNSTEFPIVVSLWQTGPLYYRVLRARETWSTDCGSVWFTVKVWLYNGENNINPGIKYSLLAGNIVGFAALGALGLGASALASQYGVSARNPDWEEWILYNDLSGALSDAETIKGIKSIPKCEFSQAGYYAGKHPHLFVSGGPVRRYEKEQKSSNLCLDWYELRVDKCTFPNDALPRIILPETHEPATLMHRYTDEDFSSPRKNNRYAIGNDEDDDDFDVDHESMRHKIDLIDHDEVPPPMPRRPTGTNERPEDRPAMPPRPPSKATTTGTFTPSVDEEFAYKINT